MDQEKLRRLIEGIKPQDIERIVYELDAKQDKAFLKGSVDAMDVYDRITKAVGLTPQEAARLYPRVKRVIVNTVKGITGLEYVEYPCCSGDYIYITAQTKKG